MGIVTDCLEPLLQLAALVVVIFEDAGSIPANRTVSSLDRLQEGDLFRGATQTVAALPSLQAAQDAGVDERPEGLEDETLGNALGCGAGLRGHPPTAGSPVPRAEGAGDLVFEEYYTNSTDSDGSRSTSRHQRGFLGIGRVQEVEELVRQTLALCKPLLRLIRLEVGMNSSVRQNFPRSARLQGSATIPWQTRPWEVPSPPASAAALRCWAGASLERRVSRIGAKHLQQEQER